MWIMTKTELADAIRAEQGAQKDKKDLDITMKSRYKTIQEQCSACNELAAHIGKMNNSHKVDRL